MILVDTSVWVDHLRKPETDLVRKLAEGDVLMHSMVIGELACGNLLHRQQRLRELQSLPKIVELTHIDVFSVIEKEGLMGQGIGFIDAHLLCSTLYHDGASLWTRDNRLYRVAEDLGISFAIAGL